MAITTDDNVDTASSAPSLVVTLAVLTTAARRALEPKQLGPARRGLAIEQPPGLGPTRRAAERRRFHTRGLPPTVYDGERHERTSAAGGIHERSSRVVRGQRRVGGGLVVLRVQRAYVDKYLPGPRDAPLRDGDWDEVCDKHGRRVLEHAGGFEKHLRKHLRQARGEEPPGAAGEGHRSPAVCREPRTIHYRNAPVQVKVVRKNEGGCQHYFENKNVFVT